MFLLEQRNGLPIKLSQIWRTNNTNKCLGLTKSEWANKKPEEVVFLMSTDRLLCYQFQLGVGEKEFGNTNLH